MQEEDILLPKNGSNERDESKPDWRDHPFLNRSANKSSSNAASRCDQGLKSKTQNIKNSTFEKSFDNRRNSPYQVVADDLEKAEPYAKHISRLSGS